MSWRELCVRREERGSDEWVWVNPESWLAVHIGLAADGRVRFEHLTAFDDGGVWLVSSVSNARGHDIVHVVCSPSESVDALDGLFASAAWHQREVSQMFGVAFVGAHDTRQAFEVAFVGAPLRRDIALHQRIQRAWPGAFEPDEGARRRPAPAPGVNPSWLR